LKQILKENFFKIFNFELCLSLILLIDFFVLLMDYNDILNTALSKTSRINVGPQRFFEFLLTFSVNDKFTPYDDNLQDKVIDSVALFQGIGKL
jgi:uncharacterized membrane protein YbhN (UPF0104 family)